MSQSKKGSVPFTRLSSNGSTDLNVLKKSITSKNDGTILLATVPSASDLLSLLYPTTPSPPLRLSSIVLTPRSSLMFQTRSKPPTTGSQHTIFLSLSALITFAIFRLFWDYLTDASLCHQSRSPYRAMTSLLCSQLDSHLSVAPGSQYSLRG